MSKQPLVSILINTYNEERFIKEAVDSALAQTYADIEVIVLDDCSKDHTPDIVKSYKDPRVKYIRPSERAGLIEGRNWLLKAAKGKYLTWLDGDDVYFPTKVAEEVEFLEAHPEFAAVYCNLAYFYDGEPEKNYHHRFKFYGGDEVFERLLEKMFITNTAVMFRREVYDKLGGYRKDLGLVEDWEYFLRMTYAGYRIAFLDRDLVHYRLRSDSHTNFARQAEIKQSAVNIFEDLKKRMTPEEQDQYDIDRHLAQQKENLVITLFSAGRKKEAMEIYNEIGKYASVKKRLVIMAMLLVPAAALRFLIERAWNYRKKNLFVPVVQSSP